MKQKLKIAFSLIALALLGITGFQIYWSVNAYRVNKEKFDNNINTAMQKAMDGCKKDYFDSIRRVLVKRPSLPETIIKIDTLHEKDTVNVQLLIRNGIFSLNFLIFSQMLVSESLLKWTMRSYPPLFFQRI